MPFNRAWEFLKAGNWYDSVDNPYGPGGHAYDGPAIDEPEPKPKPTRIRMDNSYQSILPQHDLTLDETTGWEGVPPISAIRYMGDHRAGSPVPQGDYQTSFEGAPDRELGLPGIQPDVDFNAPTVDAPHGEPAPAGWKSRPPTDKDADHGYPDKGGWLYRDPDNGAHYWYKNGVKNFMGVQEGTEGSWWSYPTEQMFDRAAGSAMNPSKVVALRGDPSKYGIAHLRDSDEARENLAEMYLEHNKNIPPEALVEVPMRENVPGERDEHYMDTARRMGIPRGKHPMFDGPTRWSDKPLPFGPPRTGRKLEDVPDSELYRAEPMDIAFQLLKESRQATLGEYDWQFPSQYGPVTKVRVLPERYLNRIASEGVQPLEQTPHQLDWEGMQEDEGLTSFDLSKPGTWWTDPTVQNIGAASTSEAWNRGLVGLRGDPNDFRHQHRDADESIEELPETYIQENIPPERLVRLPHKRIMGPEDKRISLLTDDGANQEQVDMAREYGFPEDRSMTKAFQLLKERKSPEAWANKKRYDSEYQKTPKRVKYREQLNAERRKRGIYGKGGKDVSHTQGGKLTLESPHANRARHFKSKGTLRRVKVR